ncbi:galactoside 2-alpha-L-fucosyltransferase 2-like isoform X2 [Limulus polyphemus]|uniref:L-Fucosyltransferase n=1 Tax=Limulus polyphemus TaxID=6850 RepID=A0ABM1C1K4_LIMPO|nr:galactoside 2-alpha-L-fucosyltransferase 2-like isoform X2 [Limulus polyphemus]
MSSWKLFAVLTTSAIVVLVITRRITNSRNLVSAKNYLADVQTNKLSSDLGNPDEKKLPLTIIKSRGRLGNQMGIFATLYGLSRLNNRKPVLQQHTAQQLRQFFKITIETTTELSETNKSLPYYNIDRYIRSSDVAIPKDVVILRGNQYAVSPTFYDFVRFEIRQQFRFVDPIDQYAENVLHRIQQTRSVDTFVGIHVRRTDMTRYLAKQKGAIPGNEFFKKAMNYFLSKYRNVTFVVVSDDRKWCQANLNQINVVIAPKPSSPAHDMAVLSKCNHSIVTKGTFSLWAGYLAGGETIYFQPFPPDHPYVKLNPYEKNYVPEWIGMS